MNSNALALSALDWQEVTCFYCQAAFAMPTVANQRFRESHKDFYCPYCGGMQCYQKKTDAENLREENASLRTRLEWKDGIITRANERADENERRRRSTRAVVTKLKKRAASGRCPCCSASFPDLQKHIAAKHPGYGDDDKRLR